MEKAKKMEKKGGIAKQENQNENSGLSLYELFHNDFINRFPQFVNNRVSNSVK